MSKHKQGNETAFMSKYKHKAMETINISKNLNTRQ